MLFGSTNGKLVDNSKYLYLHTVKNENQYIPYWITDDKLTVNTLKEMNLPVVYKWTIEALVLVLKAKYFFVTHGKINVFHFKRKSTILVNLWHGNPIKKVGFDSLVDNHKYVQKISQEWDLLLTSHEKFIPVFQSAFHLDKDKILPLGLPRNMILWDTDSELIIKEKIAHYYNFPIDRKIILYAPTFRDNKETQKNFHEQIEHFIANFNSKNMEEYVLLLRLHPYDKLSIDLNNYTHIYSASDYEDFQELMAASALLVTDYCSCMFDYSIMKKKIVLFLFDSKNYIKDRNGFYFDVMKLPFEKVYTVERLIESIFMVDSGNLEWDSQTFNNRITMNELFHSITENRAINYK